MRIIVLGAGTVGASIADTLNQHGHSVTVVDIDPGHTRQIYDELDVQVVTGSGSQSSVLFQAGVLGCHLCLAVTGIDEVNIVAASMAKAMGARRSIARVYAPVFRDLSTFDYQRHFNLDRMLSLEHLSAVELARGIRNPGSVVLENFARGELEVQELMVSRRAEAAGSSLKDLRLPSKVRVGAILRDDHTWIAGADDVFAPDDRITLIGRSEDLDEVRALFQRGGDTQRRVVIAGGGETGYHLARMLESGNTSVLLMDIDRRRCEHLAANLKRSTVIQADATRRVVLEEERVGSADVFVACTGDDENNIMAGVEARELGAGSIMALVGRPDYAHIVGKLGIDLAVSPRDVMARQVLSFLEEGPVVSRTPLPGGRISVFEIEVSEGAPATRQTLAELPLPPQCLIAAVMREEYVRVPGARDSMRGGDTVLALIDDQQVRPTLDLFSFDGR